MKFLPRAVTFAAVTFCAGALANAATLSLTPLPGGHQGDPVGQDKPDQQLNADPAQQVPAAQPAVEQRDATPAPAIAPESNGETQDYATLSAAVAAQESVADSHQHDDDELRCLATGIYFEARSEPLAGQLAVADVILNRTTSGRFPRSVCSVITQRGQFSFVRGGKIPTAPDNAQWRRAMAVAEVARKDLWESPAGDALYFHARYARQSWGRAHVATVGNHVFYR
jgi:spore germination cell wall hydrolase CwlJ-like protein